MSQTLERLLLALLGGFAAIFLFLSRGYNPTAALFPQVIAIASLVFLAALVIRTFIGTNRVSETPEDIEAPAGGLISRSAIFGLQGAYILLIYLLGFFAATFLFLLTAPVQLHYKRRGIVLAHAAVLTLVLAGSFLWLFDIQLPSGAVWDLW